MLKSQCQLSSTHTMDAKELEVTRNLISQIEDVNQKMRKYIPVLTEDFENGNDKSE